MNPELLHDAISLLPADMLADVDQLRQKKPKPWKGLLAAAACLCLVVGLLYILPDDMKAMDAANGSGMGMDHQSAESVTFAPMTATVIEVQEDTIVVLPGDVITDSQPITVLLTELEEIPPISEDQRVRIYYSESTDPLVPYRIEVIDE